MTSNNCLVVVDVDTPSTDAVSGVRSAGSSTPSTWRSAGGRSVTAAGDSLPDSSGRPPATGHRQLVCGACACSTSSLDDDDDAVERVAWYSQHGNIRCPEGAWNI